MGTGICIDCSSCGASEEVLLGVGWVYASLENVIDLVSPGWRDRVLSVLHDHVVKEVDYCHALFACPKCNTLHGWFRYRIVYDGGEVLESRFRCRKCGSYLVPADAEGDISQYSCKRCRRRSLSKREGMLWD